MHLQCLPTSSPTDTPTIQPTDAPTSQPTSPPTDTPTNQPTQSPSSPPSNQPTQPPPSSMPTDPPTSRPTEVPTQSPTQTPPTQTPTDPPTTPSPSSPPTNSPIPLPVPVPVPTPSPEPEPEPQPQPEMPFVPIIKPWDAEKHWWIILIVSIIVFGLIFYIVYKAKEKYNKRYYEEFDETEAIYLETNEEDEQDETLSISPDQIVLEEVIGTGSFATVHRGYYDGNEVAIKVIRCHLLNKIKDSVIEEVSIMGPLHHPNVVQFIGACFNSSPNFFLVTEYLKRGDLNQILLDQNIKIEYEHVRRFALDTCLGMEYLHKRNIIHRDLKTHNLLVDEDWTVKVSDFGLSRMVSNAQQTQTLTACGTPSWAAPEVLNEDRYSLKADVFGFAICLWQMCCRLRPYGNMTTPQIVIAVAIKGKRLEIPPEVPKQISELINLSWKQEPKSRPSFKELVHRIRIMTLPPPTSETPIVNGSSTTTTTTGTLTPALSTSPPVDHRKSSINNDIPSSPLPERNASMKNSKKQLSSAAINQQPQKPTEKTNLLS
eukprot:TRINITY_DN4365_c0_g1_i5.p1 TRINITY_DN4365_c0_g1~~TRINITY_DN4365_c0_g1_i5.p1  ORF type:complete len:543 (-),score=138.68 TRINITY_DN4365_c0_g1_i5:1364-2992(-)